MSASMQLSNREIEQFATDWYKKLDVHASVLELLPLLSDDGLRMKLPEAELFGQAAFVEWYEGVIRMFFDEVHTVKEVSAVTTDQGSSVKVVVNWQAKRWKPPAANSEWIGFDAYQTLLLRKSHETGKPVIVSYVVDELRPMPGSPQL